MNCPNVVRALAAASLAASFQGFSADIVLTPPAGFGVTVTNAAGDTNRFRVSEGGVTTLGGSLELTAGVLDLPIGVSFGHGYISKSGIRFIHNYGAGNTFAGTGAGNFTLTGQANTGIGNSALVLLTTGDRNTAIGNGALVSVSNGSSNTAAGFQALAANTGGDFNVAVGRQALDSNTIGNSNTAVGHNAMGLNTTGTGNIALGAGAGANYTTGTANIAIGHQGATGETLTTRIGNVQTRAFIAGIRGVPTGVVDAIPVFIDSAGQVGTVSSSVRVKEAIADMGEASAGLMQLRPVTFNYTRYGPGSRLQYGLVAEEVERVYPGLVAKRDDGSAETVMYHFLPPMLLNEYQKQQRRIEAQDAQIARLERRLEAMATALRRLSGGRD